MLALRNKSVEVVCDDRHWKRMLLLLRQFFVECKINIYFVLSPFN
jgi:hypothetical protein